MRHNGTTLIIPPFREKKYLQSKEMMEHNVLVQETKAKNLGKLLTRNNELFKVPNNSISVLIKKKYEEKVRHIEQKRAESKVIEKLYEMKLPDFYAALRPTGVLFPTPQHEKDAMESPGLPGCYKAIKRSFGGALMLGFMDLMFLLILKVP
eukprot:TRINITY_DN4611_c0_g1_i2.p1 TRINITY_DN4611_c0_g1~~TRINITY_DN4611_c0_g1_i2.p1  ORF type:complete len:151 (-),score=32.51 TRINITY_DN4611_c0_g1_i2:154-606(-)